MCRLLETILAVIVVGICCQAGRAPCVDQCRDVTYYLNGMQYSWARAGDPVTTATNCRIQAIPNPFLTLWTPTPDGGECKVVSPEVLVDRRRRDGCFDLCVGQPGVAGCRELSRLGEGTCMDVGAAQSFIKYVCVPY
jgi:hypothetical protein